VQLSFVVSTFASNDDVRLHMLLATNCAPVGERTLARVGRVRVAPLSNTNMRHFQLIQCSVAEFRVSGDDLFADSGVSCPPPPHTLMTSCQHKDTQIVRACTALQCSH
jgi:hypothetical protein